MGVMNPIEQDQRQLLQLVGIVTSCYGFQQDARQ